MMRNFAFEGTAFSDSGRFAGTKNLPFASRRARQTFYGESGRLKHSPHHAFGTVSSKDATRCRLPVQTVEKGLAPHFRLFLRGEGIEINHVVVRLEVEVGEVALLSCAG